MQGKSFQPSSAEVAEPASLFARNSNSISETAWACLVYSMVPYLGILFVPLAFVAGGAGLAAYYRRPALGGRRMALAAFLLSIVVFAVQIFLWWLLYVIPRIGKQF
jgi:hypothetical protein